MGALTSTSIKMPELSVTWTSLQLAKKKKKKYKGYWEWDNTRENGRMKGRGRTTKTTFIPGKRNYYKIQVFVKEGQASESLGIPISSGRKGCTQESQTCVFTMILWSTFIAWELCNFDLTDTSGGLRRESSLFCGPGILSRSMTLRLLVVTSCLEGTESISGCLHFTGKIMSWYISF